MVPPGPHFVYYCSPSRYRTFIRNNTCSPFPFYRWFDAEAFDPWRIISNRSQGALWSVSLATSCFLFPCSVWYFTWHCCPPCWTVKNNLCAWYVHILPLSTCYNHQHVSLMDDCRWFLHAMWCSCIDRFSAINNPFYRHGNEFAPTVGFFLTTRPSEVLLPVLEQLQYHRRAKILHISVCDILIFVTCLVNENIWMN
jgi:hypothetical protein